MKRISARGLPATPGKVVPGLHCGSEQRLGLALRAMLDLSRLARVAMESDAAQFHQRFWTDGVTGAPSDEPQQGAVIWSPRIAFAQA